MRHLGSDQRVHPRRGRAGRRGRSTAARPHQRAGRAAARASGGLGGRCRAPAAGSGPRAVAAAPWAAAVTPYPWPAPHYPGWQACERAQPGCDRPGRPVPAPAVAAQARGGGGRRAQGAEILVAEVQDPPGKWAPVTGRAGSPAPAARGGPPTPGTGKLLQPSDRNTRNCNPAEQGSGTPQQNVMQDNKRLHLIKTP